MVWMREENLGETQANRAQLRGSSSRFENILRITSSERMENELSPIDLVWFGGG